MSANARSQVVAQRRYEETMQSEVLCMLLGWSSGFWIVSSACQTPTSSGSWPRLAKPTLSHAANRAGRIQEEAQGAIFGTQSTDALAAA